MPYPLFIYGTLHPSRAPAAIAPTARLLRPLSRATIQARLYHFGEYPGVVLTAADESQTVIGELFSLPEDPEAADAILASFDDYEDFRPSDPTRSLFLRQQALATLQDGPEAGARMTCWVYTYNRAVPEGAA